MLCSFRSTVGLVFGLALFSSVAESASYRTQNFNVSARRAEVARQVAELAEHYRREKALEWLGTELPAWQTPCDLTVKVTVGEAGGATSFAFDQGQVVGQDMTVEGPLDRILDSVLPHEVTHTIFAAKFGRPLPRWADEGGAVLSEDHRELARHDLLVREVINTGRMIPLSRLFVLTEYPNDVMALYAQGFSVANYLVTLRGKPYYLDFVWDGQISGWDAALASYYGIRSTDELEYRWIAWLRDGRGTGADRMTLAQRSPSRAWQRSNPTMVRGQAPADEPARNAAVFTSPFDRELEARFARTGAPAAQSTAAAYESRPKSHGWLTLDGKPSPTIGETTISSSASGEKAAAQQKQMDDDSRPRLIPIAVGRTRRSHAGDTGS